jgi:hypothetical protein
MVVRTFNTGIVILPIFPMTGRRRSVPTREVAPMSNVAVARQKLDRARIRCNPGRIARSRQHHCSAPFGSFFTGGLLTSHFQTIQSISSNGFAQDRAVPVSKNKGVRDVKGDPKPNKLLLGNKSARAETSPPPIYSGRNRA